MPLMMILTLTSCHKNVVPPPSFQDGVWFYAPQTQDFISNDSMLIRQTFRKDFSFFYAGSADKDTIWLPTVRVMGKISSLPRTIQMVALSSSSLKEGVHYKLINGGMPADSMTTRLGVVLFRTSDMQTGTLKLDLELQSNTDFPALMPSDTISTDKTFLLSTHFSITVTDQLVQPPYWNDYYYFGSFSKIKYLFMISVLGGYPCTTPFLPSNADQVFNDWLKCKAALTEYNLSHPDEPLTDENGWSVYF